MATQEDTPFVVRAYNFGLKVVPNFCKALSPKEIEYYESHLEEIPAALKRGFIIPAAEPLAQPQILTRYISPWAKQMKQVRNFWQRHFDRVIDWDIVTLPAKRQLMRRLDFVFADVTEDEIFAAYAKKFGEDYSVLKYYVSITDSIASQQKRPTGNYAFCHVGSDEPDLLNKSYYDGINSRITFMTPKEGIIAAFRYRAQTGKMYDVKSTTHFSARDRGSYIMRMRRLSDGQFNVGYEADIRDYRDPDYGLRQVRF